MNALALTADEEANLQCAEETIERNLESFRETGEALMLIRDNELFRTEFKDFTEYCEKRWNFKKSHAYRLIEAAEIAADVSPIGEKPKSESHLRPLTDVPKAQRAEVWEEAVKTAPKGKVTAKHVEEVVKCRTVTIKPVTDTKRDEEKNFVDDLVCELHDLKERIESFELKTVSRQRILGALQTVVDAVKGE